jgi:hypothetical protein
MFQAEKELIVTTEPEIRYWTTDVADAIRRGCQLRPRQLFGTVDDGVDGACAMGAALVGGLSGANAARTSNLLLPGSARLRLGNPNSSPTLTLMAAVVYLNDERCWTREEIADAVEDLKLPCTPSVPWEYPDGDSPPLAA